MGKFYFYNYHYLTLLEPVKYEVVEQPIQIFEEDKPSNCMEKGPIETPQKLANKVCPVCSKKFRLSRFLKLHLETFHPGKFYKISKWVNNTHFLSDHEHGMDPEYPDLVFPCIQCTKQFDSKQRLRAHQKKSHASQDTPELFSKDRGNNKTRVL